MPSRLFSWIECTYAIDDGAIEEFTCTVALWSVSCGHCMGDA